MAGHWPEPIGPQAGQAGAQAGERPGVLSRRAWCAAVTAGDRNRLRIAADACLSPPEAQVQEGAQRGRYLEVWGVRGRPCTGGEAGLELAVGHAHDPIDEDQKQEQPESSQTN